MIQAADAYIISMPIYRGAYTGSLKNSSTMCPSKRSWAKWPG